MCSRARTRGLVLAEVELEHEAESFIRPPWLGVEVSADYRYSNSSLCLRPWRVWSLEYPAELPGIGGVEMRH